MEEYKGNCHCGAFKFNLKVPSPGLSGIKVRSCDCSICLKTGALWIFPVAEDNFIVESGKDSLQNYEFGSKKMPYSFCPDCGSSVLVRWRDGPADNCTGINARMLNNISLKTLSLNRITGSIYGDSYQPPPFPPISEVEQKLQPKEGTKIYQGNCHCKAIAYSVLTKSLDKQEVLSCNCSLCSRNADLFVYPPRSGVIVHTGSNHLTPYAFLSEDSLRCFCKVCGVSVLVKVIGEGEDKDVCPVNVRTLVEFPEMWKRGLKIKEYDGWSNEPKYII